MGIDSIGKPGSSLPPGAVGGAEQLSGASPAEGFDVGSAAEVEPAKGSDQLDRLGRGELSLGEYLDARVADATAHLEGKLALEQLEFVRRSLRQQLATDPVLVELVRRATGSAPVE
jgi:hypothetical protein